MIEQKEGYTDEPKNARKSRSGFWFGVFIILIVFAIAGAGGYLLIELRDRQSNLGGEVKGQLATKISEYQTQLNTLLAQLERLQGEIAGRDDHFTKKLDEQSKLFNERLDTARKELGEEITRLQRQLGKTRGDWLIADAEYLLGAANERLQLVGDVNTARSALEAADERLRESGDAAVFKVREEIAKEINALENVAAADTVGLYATLQSLQDSSEKLTLLLPYAGKALSPTTEIHSHADTDTDSSDSAHELLHSAIEKLHGIVTIRHTDQPVVETLTPEQAQFIREQLRAKLEIVKIALVQQNEPLYRAGLQDAKKWIDLNYTPNPATRKFVAELDRFLSINIRSHFPDISASLKLLKDITKLRIDTDKVLQPAPSETKVLKPAPSETQKPVEMKTPPQQPAAVTAPPAAVAPAQP